MRFTAALVAALCALPGVSLASTIAPTVLINDPAGESTASALGAGFDNIPLILFEDSVGGETSCSGALISSTTVLTAKHCLPGADFSATAVFTDGTAVSASNTQSIDTTGFSVLEPFPLVSLVDGTDLAILTLESAITSLSPLKLAAEVFVGELARIVGYGRIGVGSEPAEANAFFVRRGAENVIDGIGTAYNTEGVAFDGSGNILSADFDDPTGTSNTMNNGPEFSSSAVALENEGMIGQGDSGGPLLVQRNGEWVVAGVASAISNEPGSPRVFNSTYGTIGYWTGVSEPLIRTGIENTGFGVYVAAVPLPASAWFLGFGVLGLWGASRRAKRAS